LRFKRRTTSSGNLQRSLAHQGQRERSTIVLGELKGEFSNGHFAGIFLSRRILKFYFQGFPFGKGLFQIFKGFISFNNETTALNGPINTPRQVVAVFAIGFAANINFLSFPVQGCFGLTSQHRGSTINFGIQKNVNSSDFRHMPPLLLVNVSYQIAIYRILSSAILIFSNVKGLVGKALNDISASYKEASFNPQSLVNFPSLCFSLGSTFIPKEDLNVKAVDLPFGCAGRNADHSAIVFRLGIKFIAICRDRKTILNITPKFFHPHIPHLLQSSASKATPSCLLT